MDDLLNKVDRIIQVLTQRAQDLSGIMEVNRLCMVLTRWVCPHWDWSTTAVCQDYCRIFHLALFLGKFNQSVGNMSIKHDPFYRGENSDFPFSGPEKRNIAHWISTVHHSTQPSKDLENVIASDQSTHFITKEAWWWINDRKINRSY